MLSILLFSILKIIFPFFTICDIMWVYLARYITLLWHHLFKVVSYFYSLFFSTWNRDFFFLFHLIYQGTIGSNKLHEIWDKFIPFNMSCHEYGMHIIVASFHITTTNGCHSLRAYHFKGLSLRTNWVHELLLYLFSFLIIG